MQLGQRDLLFKEPVSKKVDSDVGAVGTEIYSGYITGEEYNSEWTEDEAISNVDKMIKTDAQVKASVKACILPVLSTTATIEPYSEDKADVEVAEFAEGNLLKNPNFLWQTLLEHVLLYLQYGFYCFAKNKYYNKEDGKIWYKELRPLKPKTIERWMQNDDGTLNYIEQFAYVPNKGYKTIPVSNDDLVIFTNEQEGYNWRGISILRSAYRSWYAKDALIRISSIAAERQGAGVFKIKLPPQHKTSDVSAAQEVGEYMRAHQSNYIVEPPGYESDFMDMHSSGNYPILDFIKFHNTEISANILGQYMDLGKSGTGSYALSQTLSGMFLMALQATANHIENIFNETSGNRRVIKEIVDWNFTNVKNYPKLRFGKLKDVDFDSLASALATMAQNGLITPDEKLEEYIRKAAKLPEKEQVEEAQKVAMKEQYHEHIHLSEPTNGGFWRELTEKEKEIGVEQIDKFLSDARQEMIDLGNKYRSQMINGLVEKGEQLLVKKVSFEEFTRILQKIEVPKQSEMETKLRLKLRDIYDFSRQKVRAELKNQDFKLQEPVSDDKDTAKKALAVLAALSVAFLATKLRDEFIRIMTRQRVSGIVDTVTLRNQLTALSKKDMMRDMRGRATEAFGIARTAEAREQIANHAATVAGTSINKLGVKKALKMPAAKQYKIPESYSEQIKIAEKIASDMNTTVKKLGVDAALALDTAKRVRIIHSEVTDSPNICDPCFDVDGTEMTIDDPRLALFPDEKYVNCEGQELCRGFNIYIKE